MLTKSGLPPVRLNVVGEITSLVTPPAPAQAYGRDVGEVGMRGKGSQNHGEEPERMSRLAVIGAGYARLVTSVTLADLGHDVWCADIVPEKVAMLSWGEIPIVELGHLSRNSRIPATSKRSHTTKGAAWTSH